jgi:hypothetical protein
VTSQSVLSRVIARCWTDPAFKARLLADPVAVLREDGVEVPDGLQVKVLENTQAVQHWVLPSPPRDVSDAELAQAAGGVMVHLYNDQNYGAQYRVNKGQDVIARLPRPT